ncbi:glycosyl hydrolase [Thalassotalea sp. PLHSN55]|uniref:glycosyl hydrolase n=1 Tax=Thalassotalea sp. PLHSN55 TaxID=3435888 RepID=UPI003F8739E9
MKKLFKLGVLTSLSLALSACGNEDSTTTYIPDAGSDGKENSIDIGPTIEPVMLNYLNEIKGTKTVIGIHNDEKVLENDPSYWTKQAAEVAGAWPALWSTDFGYTSAGLALRGSMVAQAEGAWAQGALINVMMHVCPPTMGEECGWEGGVLSDLSEEQWADLLADGGSLNQAWKARLDSYADIFSAMNQRGVRVLFRPFHEMNQTLFWWSLAGKPEYTAELYRLTHDYLVTDKELTNLTFVWNLQDFATLEQDLQDYDPGAGYWDVLSLDNYNTDGQGFSQAKYDVMLAKAGDKPIGIGETSHLPSLQILEQQPSWSFVMTWSELTFTDNSDASIRSFYNASNVVTLEDKDGWPGYQDDNRVVLAVPGDGGSGGEGPVDVVEPFVVFDGAIEGWASGQADKVTSEVVDAGEGRGNVLQHTYIGGETVSELIFDTPQDLSAYAEGTVQFDMKIVTQPDGITSWAMKIDCGWPCGTGDVALTANVDETTPEVGQWQTYTFNIADLLELNDENALTIDNVTSPLVIVPQPWSAEQIGVVIQLDNINYFPPESDEEPQASNDFVVFDDEINGWAAGQVEKVTQEIVDASGGHGKVVQHTYIGGETVSELIFETPQDLSAYVDGTIEFDLKIDNQPSGITGWAMKIDCGWPCGTGDVDLMNNLDGIVPVVGQWQTYKFNIADLMMLNGDNALTIDYVTSPLVIVPQPWSNEQIGVVIQLDNIRYKTAQSTQEPEVEGRVIFADAVDAWSAGQAEKVTQEIVDAGGEYGNVIQHTYIAGETVSELIFDNPQDLTEYQNGKISFDLRVVEQPSGITGWAMKIDCGWPCGTGDVALTDSVEGASPTVGNWQTFTFNVSDLMVLNGDNALTIDYVTSPLVIVPQPWSNEQVGVILQLDNIIYTAN